MHQEHGRRETFEGNFITDIHIHMLAKYTDPLPPPSHLLSPSISFLETQRMCCVYEADGLRRTDGWIDGVLLHHTIEERVRSRTTRAC